MTFLPRFPGAAPGECNYCSKIMAFVCDKSFTLTARFVIPVDGPPIAGGTIRIEGARIAGVDSPGIRSADIDLGNRAILPGLVNAHTHLDLSGLRGQVPPSSDFVGWLRCVIAQRRSQNYDRVLLDIQSGIEECLASGTTLVGDISAGGRSWNLLAQSAPRAIVFYELLGLTKVRALPAWAEACAWLNARPNMRHCRPGLSPHAPYSVRRSLFAAAKRLAKERDLPLAVHLAESPAELELLEKRAGPMLPFLTDLGVFDPEGLVDSAEELADFLGELPNHLLVHSNYLTTNQLPAAGKNVVYCPRTHHAFGHSPYPLAQYLRQGVRVALGTDSLASNPDLSLFKEAQFVCRQHPDISPAQILNMATIAGAQMLGFGAESGSLTAGKSADLAIVDMPNADDPDPCSLVLDARASVNGVMIGGIWYKDPINRSTPSRDK